MTWFEIYALVWPGIVTAVVIGFGYFLVWLDDRSERRKSQHVGE